jgi:hypothetical protein
MSAAATKARARAVGSIQRRFQSAIMDERGARGSPAFLPELEPSREMSAAERLDVYATAYFLRLRDVMKTDFRGVLHALGERAFSRVVREYVTKHPSESFTLNDLGRRFARFLEKSRAPAVARRRRFLVELATLERAVEDVFHEKHAAPVDVERLRSIAPDPERWMRARFTTNPALRLLAFDHPVDPYLQAVLDGRSPRVPSPRPSWLAVYRHDWRTWRARLSREQFELLSALHRGRPLGAALKHVLSSRKCDPDLIRSRLHDWFAEWTRDGLFTSIEVK